MSKSYECPRCGALATKQSKSAWMFGGGLIGVMLAAAFASYECGSCGKIARKEFPPDIQKQMMKGTIGLAVGAAVLLFVILGIIIALSLAA